MIDRMVEEIPGNYFEGVAAVDVSGKTVRHPDRPGIYTMGECIELPMTGDDDQPTSRVVLYHGSFAALARDRDDFDWRAEAWETLTHELRHHLEGRANERGLEEYDRAADEGFARADDEPFDPAYYLGGERVEPDTYLVDDDLFFDRVVKERPASVDVEWSGRRYRVAVPDAPLPLYLLLAGIDDAPPGDVILSLRRKPSLWDLFRRYSPLTERNVEVTPLE